jgi:hypothetical protein
VARLALFEQDADYEAFERVLAEAMQVFPTRLLSYCLVPIHWHMVIWPRQDGELTQQTQIKAASPFSPLRVFRRVVEPLLVLWLGRFAFLKFTSLT